MNTWSAKIARGAAILGLALVGTGTESAAAAGDSGAADGRMRPDPPGTYSIYNPGPMSSPAIAEQLIPAGKGIVRVAVATSDAEDNGAASDAVPTATVHGPNGQAMRVRSDVDSDAPAGAWAAATPPDAYTVSMGNAKALVLPNDVTALGTEAAPLQLAPDVQIVDLPPGAVAPDGMPEPMTLYRVTDPGPASASDYGRN